MIEIVQPGPLATIQDAGRRGYAHLGVARSGAFDRAALALANRLVGNPPGAAVIEVTLGAFSFRAVDAVTVALTGAPCPGLDQAAAVTLAPGAMVVLGTPPRGLRSYLAVRGGIAVKAELGSRSTDTLGGLGPAALKPGDRLPIGPEPTGDVSGSAAPPTPTRAALRVLPGPRADWFTDALGALLRTEWRVRAESDRVGIRLDGPPLQRSQPGELPSEATLPGALQIPPDGRPVLFGPDAPTTGGYPVVAVVRERDLDAAAQLRPGDPVRFTLG